MKEKKYYKTLKDFKDYSQNKAFDLSDLNLKETDLKGTKVDFLEKDAFRIGGKYHYPLVQDIWNYEDSEKAMRYFYFHYPCTYMRYVHHSKALFYNFILWLEQLREAIESNIPHFIAAYKNENQTITMPHVESARSFATEKAWTDFYAKMDSFFTDPENITIFEAMNNPIFKKGLEGEGDYGFLSEIAHFVDFEGIPWEGALKSV